MKKSQSRFKLFSLKKDLHCWYLFGIDFYEDKCYFLKTVPNLKHSTEYYSIIEAREVWKNLIKEGNIKVNLSVTEHPSFVSIKLCEWAEFARVKRNNLRVKNPWVTREEIEEVKNNEDKYYIFNNNESIKYQEPLFFREIGTNNSIREWNRKGSRHILYLMSKDTLVSIFAIDKLNNTCAYLLELNAYSETENLREILLLKGDDIKLKRNELFKDGFKDFYSGIVSGLVFQRIGAWIGIKNTEEDIVVSHLLKHWSDEYMENKTPQMIDIIYDSGSMDLKFRDPIEYEDIEEEPKLAVKVNTGLQFEEDIDNYWNQEGVFEEATDQSDQFL